MNRNESNKRPTSRLHTLRISLVDSTRGMLPIDQSKQRREGQTSSQRLRTTRWVYVKKRVEKWVEKEAGLSDSTK